MLAAISLSAYDLPLMASSTRRAASTSGFTPRADPDSGLSANQVQKLYEQLLDERERLMEGVRRHVGEAVADPTRLPDEGDQAAAHASQAYLLRVADKETKMLRQVVSALEKMETSEYGMCEGSGEPIGFKRLSIRPWTRYGVQYKEQLEREKKGRAP